MKRKIAAIFAADIAGYSRLVAEDEEETLRRLASGSPRRPFYRSSWCDSSSGAISIVFARSTASIV